MSVTRRDLLKGSAAIATGAALGVLAGCSPQPMQSNADGTSGAVSLPDGIIEADFEASPVELEPIADCEFEESYDIVVVGAGCAGVPAVLTALDEGASVCCLQKEVKASANGAGAAAVLWGHSTPGGVATWMSRWMKESGWRVNRELFQYWVDHSEEALSYIIQKGLDAGIEPNACSTSDTVVFENGETAAVFKVIQPGNQELMEALCASAEAQGAVFHYATPAVQLVQDEAGAVTGVIGKSESGYIKVNASKGVILATGDYMNNISMLKRYNGDVVDWQPDLVNHTGDGHILGTLAGGRIAPAPHPRQIHSLFSDNRIFLGTPLLNLDPHGKRFMDEECVMTDWNTVMKYCYDEDTPKYLYRFFDSGIEEKYPGVATLGDVEALVQGTIEGGGERGSGVGQGLATYKGDTIEELCVNMGIEDPKPFVESIERYNELCAQGSDSDFGKLPEYMKAVDTPPFYGIINNPETLSADNGGLLVDEHYQVVDAQRNPIPRLFAAGVCAGDLCGGINWIMPGGSSNGHCFTAGRYTVIYALTGGLKPSTPASFDDVSDMFADENGQFMWEKPHQALKNIIPW